MTRVLGSQKEKANYRRNRGGKEEQGEEEGGGGGGEGGEEKTRVKELSHLRERNKQSRRKLACQLRSFGDSRVEWEED